MMGETSAGAESPFLDNLRLRDILRGRNPYDYDAFYQVKEVLLRYGESTDFVNYGYWVDGARTEDPSRELVRMMGRRLDIRADDVILDVGAGLGGPDLVLLDEFRPARIVGINACEAQVAYANARLQELALTDRVSHRVVRADEIARSLRGEGISAALCVEAIADIREMEQAVHQLGELLPEGGRIAICGETRVRGRALRRPAGRALMQLTSSVYTDSWRFEDEYLGWLEKAGFRDLAVERIGKAVYPFNWQHVRAKRDALRALSRVSTPIKWIGIAQFGALSQLYAWGEIEYSVIWGEKRTSDARRRRPPQAPAPRTAPVTAAGGAPKAAP